MPRLCLSPSLQINCPTKTPCVFAARLKPPATGDSRVCGAGARAGASLRGTRSLPGGCSPQETPRLQGTGTSLTLRVWTGITSKAMPHCWGVCCDARPLQTKLSADFHTTHCLPFAHLDSANSLHVPAFLTRFWGTHHQPEAASYPPAALHGRNHRPSNSPLPT